VVLAESQKIPETFVPATVQVVLEARLDTLKQQVLSNDRLWALIQEFKLYSDQRARGTREEVLALMRSDITIGLERSWSATRPGAFRVSYTAHDARTAADVTNRIARFFIEENLRERAAEAKGTSQFLEAQLEDARRQLHEQELRLSAYKRNYNGELPQQEAALLAQMGQSRIELLGTQDAIARAQQNKAALEATLNGAEASLRERTQRTHRRALENPPPEATASIPARELSELDRARIELRDLRLRYHDQHPEVQRVIREIARLEAQQATTGPNTGEPASARTEVRTAATPEPEADVVAEAEAARIRDTRSQLAVVTRDVENLDAQRKRILQDIADTQLRLKAVPIREQELATITRDYDTMRASYSSLLSKKFSADVAKDMEQEQKAERFVMLDRARVPEKPVRPHKGVLIMIGSIGSLVASAALAFLLEWKRNTLLGEWELPAGAPVLGRIPRLRVHAAS
jgi:polysaccharide chain length determinant protein (PEP-CTERM system associated)